MSNNQNVLPSARIGAALVKARGQMRPNLLALANRRARQEQKRKLRTLRRLAASRAPREPVGLVKVATTNVAATEFTVDELKALAKEHGLTGYSKLNKTKLIDKLTKAGLFA